MRVSSSYRLMWMILKPYRAQITISIFLAALPSYFNIWTPYLLGELVDEGVLARDFSQVVLLGFLLLLVYLCIFVFSVGVNYCLSAFGLNILVVY